MPEFSPTLIERFWKYVDISAGPNACWLWIGYTTKRRAGRTNRGGGREGRICNQVKGKRRMLRATRVALAIATGEWHEDDEACHTAACEDSLCCQFGHLYWASHAQNMADETTRHGGVGWNRTP